MELAAGSASKGWAKWCCMVPGQKLCCCHIGARLAKPSAVPVAALTSVWALTPLIPKEDVPAGQRERIPR